MDDGMDSFDKLLYLNRELFKLIENSISIDLLARLYSSQLVTRGERHLLDNNRLYYRLLRKIVSEGQQRGELATDTAGGDIVKAYALCERALLYDWCLCNGDYSLVQYSTAMLPKFLSCYRSTAACEFR